MVSACHISLAWALAKARRRLEVGLEEFVLLDVAAEGVGCDAVARKQAALDAGAVDGGDVVRIAVKLGADLVDDLGEQFGLHLAGQALVGAAPGVHRGDAVFLVAGVPGLDGAPGELVPLVVLLGEDDAADVLDAVDNGVAGRELDGAEHAHLQVRGDAFHAGGLLAGCVPLLIRPRRSGRNRRLPWAARVVANAASGYELSAASRSLRIGRR